jgi:hypothetical protein
VKLHAAGAGETAWTARDWPTEADLVDQDSPLMVHRPRDREQTRPSCCDSWSQRLHSAERPMRAEIRLSVGPGARPGRQIGAGTDLVPISESTMPRRELP